MAEIFHKIGIQAPVARVYEAAATLSGLRGWWTTDTSGQAEVGGTITFKFLTPEGELKGEMKMEVTKLIANELVVWTVRGGPPDWIGTQIEFKMSYQEGMTLLLFKHSRWQEATESLAHCSMKWATFLLSMKDYVQTGQGKPSPKDLKIDNWN